ncbi:electron transport complex subunit RsxB [Limnohabitans sp. Rim11]|uniref:electron transport complex subunit RsxB n=1 Tax=Limnohabitans sp. Rim11 TaxID=1100719 RepID=UPI000ADFB003|nr:electron transport complex subunit RsxB [Limnohabitans sp. Rim11]
MSTLADGILDALPQTQCTRCGYPDCKAYAQAIALEQAPINQCPPGGAEGVAVLARLTGKPVQPLNLEHGLEGPMTVAVIDEAWCIGCTLCIKACPTDAILGSNKVMHTVIESVCTGCDLCLPVCPVDCIEMVPISGDKTGWAAWSAELATQARVRYESRQIRLVKEEQEHAARQEAKAAMKLADLETHTHVAEDPDKEMARKRAIIAAAMAKAKARQAK